MKYEKGRINEVVNIVGQRLLSIRKFNSAAEIYESIGDFEQAIDAFISAELYDRALDVAKNVTPVSLRDKMIRDIQNQKREFLLKNN
jgi:intraflagellar transport protein 172